MQIPLIPVNKYQTQIDQKLKDSLDDDVWMNLTEFIESVEFVKQLISPDRPTIAEATKDANGYVIPDITKPHILSDMDFFVKDRDHFNKHGYYTSAVFSKDPRSKFRMYWDEQIRRSLEGYENPDTGEWISGYNYFYWNFGRIYLTVEHAEREDSKHNLASRAGKRRAFKSKSKRVRKIKNKGGKTRADRIESFPDIWEIDYWFFHYIEQGEAAGEYGSLLKCRGMGASFKGAGFFNRNYFLLEGSKSYAFAYSDDYLTKDGLLTKTWDMEGFVQKNTAFTKRKLISRPTHRRSGYYNKETMSDDGYLSEIIGVNTKNPDAGRGKRGKIVVHEEAGSHKHLTKVWSITDKSLDDKGYVFGYQLAMGTGGDADSDFIGLTRLHFTPKGYNVTAIPNVFDLGAKNDLSGFFMGEYMNRPGSYNSDGITDVVGNLITIFKARSVLEKEIDDPSVLEQKKAEGAITPLEAIVVMEQSVFPTTAVKARLAETTPNLAELVSNHYIGWLTRNNDTAKFTTANERFVIRDYPYLGKQANKAALQVFAKPIRHTDGTIPSYRYIIGVDTLEEDEGMGSLFSVSVWDLWLDKEVADYTGRSIMVDDDYEMVLALAVWYNATVNYENNLKGLYGYFKNNNALRYLADTPQIVIDKGYQKNSGYSGNKSKGTRATKGINSWGRNLQATWMRKPHEDGGTGLDTCENIGYLREVGMWKPMGNYDRISCKNMVFIYREELVKITNSNKFSNLASSKAEYANDDFFADVFDNIESASDDL